MEPVQRRIEKALAAVSEIASGLASKEPSALLQQIVDTARRIFPADVAMIALFDSAKVLQIRASSGAIAVADPTLTEGKSILGAVATSGRSEVVSDVRRDPRRSDWIDLAGIDRGVFAPLVVDGVTIGALMVGQKVRPAALDDHADLVILGMLAEQAASVVKAGESLHEERTFSTKLLRLSGYFARAGAGWEPEVLDELLREISLAAGGEAGAITELGEDGSCRIGSSWNLPVGMAAKFAAAPEALPPLIAFSRVLDGGESGFPEYAFDLNVRIPRTGRETLLHVFSGDTCSPFKPGDVRLAEVMGVHLGALLDRLAMLHEIRHAAECERSASLRLRELYDDIEEGILVLDGQGKVTFCSRRACHMLYSSPNRLLGNGLVQALDPEDRMPLLNAFLKGAAGSRSTGEFRIEGPAGMRTIDFTARPDDRDDPTRSVRMVLRDVTDERRRESDTLHREKLASVGELAAGVAHEINNPVSFVLSNHRFLVERLGELTSAIGLYRTLASAPEATRFATKVAEMEKSLHVVETLEELPQLLADSLEGLERVRKIVADMRLFARKDSENPTVVDLSSLIDSTLGMSAPMIRMKAKLVKDVGPIPAFRGWPGRLGQALVNLVVNAAQAIPAGRPEDHEVRVKAWSDAESIYVAVSDTGSGIAPRNRMKLFSPFFTTKPPGEGTGLGLALAYETVRRHAGRIGVESEVGVGTTFTISIPLNGVPEASETAADATEKLEHHGALRVAV